MAEISESYQSQALEEKDSFSFESGHSDLIHDIAIDFYGKTLASASSDRIIRIFEIIGNNQKLVGKLTGHRGPIWKLSWAHPKYGNILASASYDKQVIIWRQNQQHKWIQWFVDDKFTSSVNTVQFYSQISNNNNNTQLELIAGSSDGTIKIYTFQNNKWRVNYTIDDAHKGGVNSISWSNTPNAASTASDKERGQQKRECKRFVTGGCDNLVKIWNFEYKTNEYSVCATLNEHENWVRDVSWSPIPTSKSNSIIASCSEDKTVIIWKENNNKWTISEKIKFDFKVWSVSWSELGNILAVALGENTIQLFKQGNDGKWQNVTKIT